ncbi:MAG: hypothetical protein V8K32_08415 [Candidatus Electrothrix gigas]
MPHQINVSPSNLRSSEKQAEVKTCSKEVVLRARHWYCRNGFIQAPESLSWPRGKKNRSVLLKIGKLFFERSLTPRTAENEKKDTYGFIYPYPAAGKR